MNIPEVRPFVLIAEDDPDDRKLLREAFADRCPHCELHFVRNGEELLEFLATRTTNGPITARSGFPHLLLLDLNMPLKDGRETLIELQRNRQYAGIATVVLSTSDSTEDRLFCLTNGAGEYLIKPPGYTQLLDLVSALSVYLKTDKHLPDTRNP